MISVAAELAEMHPQTLRMYEARGLISPRRSPKNTRLYSYEDVERLRRIQRMTDEGLNLAGVKRVLELEAQVAELQERMAQLQEDARHAIDAAHRTYRRDLVPLSQALELFGRPLRQG